jgi:hypothetical protein
VKPKDVVIWATIAAMILAGGIWLGKLQQQVADMEKADYYLHGTVSVPQGFQVPTNPIVTTDQPAKQ